MTTATMTKKKNETAAEPTKWRLTKQRAQAPRQKIVPIRGWPLPLLPCPQPRMYDDDEDGDEEKREGFDRSSEDQRSTEKCCSFATSEEEGNNDDIDSEEDRPLRTLAQSRHD
ncbi:hypothetical protein PF005_g2145 [Phytophthora fragariae]|uniref:Uncharacterized protein n=2 Tax=Phytophthora fragariae TaxID=53985 RepID=A0A6A3MCT3_9STRA|nr:hypothetical protein PF009_g1118 [Phytophthora fragariae]KAE9028597.1 hypothetical protein PF011_g1495 [Phytophthora fragariae]KAE9155113.1 hypothetical protein PF006_g928 [Phytophthora fragariae]KAE9233874.1 hypothetical protein PF005_g2145 [Phytophthora fragariae]KAE9252560.1 hypothetical protein PF004_g1907 [Phytophthora fragariae]